MSLPKFNEDMQIISKLADEPNDVGGLSANELKAKFDEAGNIIKAFINDTLLPYLEAATGAGDIGISNIPGLNDAATVQAALQELKTQLNNTSTGSIPDRSLTGEKLVTGAVGTNELANASVTLDKIASGAVNDSKIAAEKLSGASIQAKAIQNSHLNGKVVKAENVEDNSLTGDQIKDLSIPAGKIASGAVQTAKIADGAVTRAKLAADALYSPITKPTTTTYNVVASDLGKTIIDDYSTRKNNLTWNLSKSLLDSSPIGTEIAFARAYTSHSITLNITGARIINADSGQVGGASQTVSFSLPEKGSMCALKKFQNDSTNGSFWILTGNVEVVS